MYMKENLMRMTGDTFFLKTIFLTLAYTNKKIKRGKYKNIECIFKMT